MNYFKMPLKLSMQQGLPDYTALSVLGEDDLNMLSAFLMRALSRHTCRPRLLKIGGAVSVGKTTLAVQIRDRLQLLSPQAQIVLLSTDHFLMNNKALLSHCGLEHKGFPESYDPDLLDQFFSAWVAGRSLPRLPVYSHQHYDHIPGAFQQLPYPDVLIVEGVVALNSACVSAQGFGLFVDAPEACMEQWYAARFLHLCLEARACGAGFFSKFSSLSDAEILARAKATWVGINRPNAVKHIEPTRAQAQCVLVKKQDHAWASCEIDPVYCKDQAQ